MSKFFGLPELRVFGETSEKKARNSRSRLYMRILAESALDEGSGLFLKKTSNENTIAF